ncbi:MAG: hypothetical protein KGH72_03330 [Candidatus Micrarchaeota archaeon]|nr:hypothetical protein [Candidatus Micrarchaeota archaeon]
MAKGNKPNHVAFTFEFVGAFMFLVILIGVVASGASYGSVIGQLAQSSNSFWLPIVYGVAVAGTISLFCISFTNLTRENPAFKYAPYIAVANGSAWAVLAAGNTFLSALALISFGLSLAGALIGLSEVAN